MAGEPVHTHADGELPPPSEEVHLPEPSYLPVFLAFGLTIALVGLLLSWVICGIGAAIFLVTLFKWIRSARQELSDLPLEH
jgi:ABC-type lipoprotein release transport system permease subunit